MPHSAFTLSLGHQKISDYNYAITILYFKKLVLSSLLTLSFNNPNKQQQQQPFYGHCCVSWHLQLRAGTDSKNNAKKQQKNVKWSPSSANVRCSIIAHIFITIQQCQ